MEKLRHLTEEEKTKLRNEQLQKDKIEFEQEVNRLESRFMDAIIFDCKLGRKKNIEFTKAISPAVIEFLHRLREKEFEYEISCKDNSVNVVIKV